MVTKSRSIPTIRILSLRISTLCHALALLIEEFGPELEYVKGQNNIVADALSHLNILDHEFTQEVLAFGSKEFPKFYPLSFAQIEFE